jgi:hypothetical protein
MVPKQCTIHHIIVEPSKIHHVRFILEAYEGIGQVTTIDPSLGLLRLSIAPGCEEDVARILEGEAAWLQLRSISTSNNGSR